jgi:hypothetical protein
MDGAAGSAIAEVARINASQNPTPAWLIASAVAEGVVDQL